MNASYGWPCCYCQQYRRSGVEFHRKEEVIGMRMNMNLRRLDVIIGIISLSSLLVGLAVINVVWRLRLHACDALCRNDRGWLLGYSDISIGMVVFVLLVVAAPMLLLLFASHGSSRSWVHVMAYAYSIVSIAWSLFCVYAAAVPAVDAGFALIGLLYAFPLWLCCFIITIVSMLIDRHHR